LVSVAQLIASTSNNYWIVLSFLTLAGSAAAAWHPVAMGVMAQWMPNRKGYVLGVHMMGGTVAEVAAPLMVGMLLMILDWDQVLQISTIPSIIMGLIFFRLAPMVMAPTKELDYNLDRQSLLRSVIKPEVLLILFMFLLHNMAIVAFMGMGPLYFQEVKGFSSSMTGLAFSLFLIGGAVAAPLVGNLSDRVGRKVIIMVGLIAGGFCTGLIIFASSNISILPLLIIAGLLMLSNRSVIIAMALEKIGHRESTVLGVISSFAEGFAALGAVLAGILGGIDLQYAIIFAAILSISAGLVIYPVNRNN
jgi:MFS family permease